MIVSIDNDKWHDRLWAALDHYTALPLSRLYRPAPSSYAHVAEYWPLVAWLTSSVAAALLWFGSLVMPFFLAVVAAVVVRGLLTGFKQEYGLVRFAWAFALGRDNRRRVFELMSDEKPSGIKIGFSGFIVVLYAVALSVMPVEMACLTLVAAEPFAKMLGAQLTVMMPHARLDTALNGPVEWARPSTAACIGLSAEGLLPAAVFSACYWGLPHMHYLLFVPCLVMYALYMLVWRRMRYFTAECCAAVAIAAELSIYATMVCINFFM